MLGSGELYTIFLVSDLRFFFKSSSLDGGIDVLMSIEGVYWSSLQYPTESAGVFSSSTRKSSYFNVFFQ